MKKIIALSLTFALASAGAITALTPHSHSCDECSATIAEQNIVNRDMLIGNGFAVVNRDGHFNVVPKKPINLNVVDGQNLTNTSGYNNNNYNTSNVQNGNLTNNNMGYAAKGTSPYGIGNANSGVLPNNGNGNQTLDQNYANNNTRGTNLDTMVRTNNLDTYKNNANRNIDNNIYDNNGGNITNPMLANNNEVNNANTNNLTNTTPLAKAPSTSTTNNINTKSSITSNYVSPKTTNNTKTNQNTILKNNTTQKDVNYQNTTMSNLHSQLTTQREEFNQKIEKINSILAQYDNQTIKLDGEQATLMNGYIDVIQKLTQKLMRSRYLMAFDIENFWDSTTFDLNDTKNPYYLEAKSVLGGRIICLDCINEALDRIMDILNSNSNTQNDTNTTTRNNSQAVVNSNTKTNNTTSNVTNYNSQTKVADNLM